VSPLDERDASAGLGVAVEDGEGRGQAEEHRDGGHIHGGGGRRADGLRVGDVQPPTAADPVSDKRSAHSGHVRFAPVCRTTVRGVRHTKHTTPAFVAVLVLKRGL
jgi:hypothetical protein